MAPPAAAAASWITPSSLPAWGSGLSRRSTSRRRTALFIGGHAPAAFGDSGPLVLSFAALEDYRAGRDWERYAMVKARIMGDNDGAYASELRAMLRPSSSAAIDFSVIQSLRNMKGMIAREVRRRGLKDNIKLGAGGIREIEFIVQVFQLIRGGREPALQQRALPTLAAIDELHLLPEGDATLLRAAYLFLRRLENLLQSINDEQTQTLPQDELNRARLAWGCIPMTGRR